MKKMVTLALALAFVVSTAAVGMAASVNCEVKSVDGNTVTMECKKADSLKAGQKVKVKASKATAIEGC
ncbi:MAG: hypothetical protein OEY01_04520 [Desulfobulbaceae bacterium]|nr:hypothetical protein [Desulfobulbaceae bacterium]HIJ78444.1 hypothetical protein [Deltaproteobacteria bacterium]